MATLLLLSIIFLTYQVNGIPRFEPLPRCNGCVSRARILAPGIGFDLTTSYGTAAIRNNDGTIVNVAKATGNPAYESLMLRLSSEPQPQRSDGMSFREELGEAWKRLKRRLNKLFGRPATTDVGTLGSLMSTLRVMTEKQLEQRVDSALVATPELPGLTEEDIDDALEFAGLKSLKGYNMFGSLLETTAAFAGSGFGLCQNYTDIDLCEHQEDDFPWQRVLAIQFTEATLSTVLTTLADSHSNYQARSSIDWDAGLGAMSRFPDAAVYWDHVRDKIRLIAAPADSMRPLKRLIRTTNGPMFIEGRDIGTLLLLGESAAQKKFLEVVRDALQDIQGRQLMFQAAIDLDPLYVAARGAAELAKRFQEAPFGCEEAWYCRWNRRTLGFMQDL